ncbi:MAG: B12-binding domain-containing radical SAM protein [Nitrospirae bacterium]|nr:MAG: B12-binding domain-containing radical SAM protein [Nitrospirota bacterium]
MALCSVRKLNMDAVFINPFPSGEGLNEATVIPPIGLGYIAAVLERDGFNCMIIDANLLRLNNAEIIDRVPEKTPLIGIYLNSFLYDTVKDLTSVLSKKFKDTTIILGGPLPTAEPEMILREMDCNGIVRGEGEYAVLGIMRNIKKALFPFYGEISGAVYYDSNSGAIVRNSVIRIVDLDALPFPAYHLLPHFKFYKIRRRKSPSAPIISSRGCAYGCIFCSKDIFEKKISFRSSGNILAEVDYLVKHYGIRQLDIMDDNFAFNKARMIEILDGIIEKKYDIAINIQSGIRTELVDEPLLDKMKKAGVYKLAFGIESADKDVLMTCHKQINLDKVKEVVTLAKKKGFLVYGFFIIGLPGETDESFERTLEYAKKLDLDIANFCMAVPFVGTELYRMVNEKGRFLIDTERNISSGFYDGKVFYEYEGAKAADILVRYKKAYSEFYTLRKKIGLLFKIRSFSELRWFLSVYLMIVKGLFRSKK